ncbi:sugar nucleotide-binding protein [Candidatus Nomurabacteria bacterium]|nr:sugar nucleotide-binding protein [Candidatus Nomurabacteria bacterium]
MKRVLILGVTGMLGSALYDVLKEKYSLVLSTRDEKKVAILEKTYGDTSKHQIVSFDVEKVYQEFVEKKGYPSNYLSKFKSEVGEVDYVINAIGVTIPFSLKNPALTFFINGGLPHILAQTFKNKFIHITTDCVYNGKEGFPYDENSQKSPVDIYGLSKSLGEPTSCLTLRTSIIGRELEGFTGFLEWFLQQEGKEITGFAELYWNGVSTKEFAKLCDKIISEPEKYPKIGLYHVFSTPVSKYEMLLKFKEKFKINCVIKEDHENKLNRTLATAHEFNSKLNIASFGEMINEL